MYKQLSTPTTTLGGHFGYCLARIHNEHILTNAAAACSLLLFLLRTELQEYSRISWWWPFVRMYCGGDTPRAVGGGRGAKNVHYARQSPSILRESQTDCGSLRRCRIIMHFPLTTTTTTIKGWNNFNYPSSS